MMDQDPRTKPRYSTIFYFLGQYKLLYSAVLVLIVVSSLLESFSVAAVFPLFSSLLGDSPDSGGGILGFTNNIVGFLPISNRTVAGAVLLIGAFSIKILFVLCRDIMIGFASAKVLYDVKNRMLTQYANAHYRFYLDNQQGKLIYNTLSAPSAVHSAVISVSHALSSLLRVVFISAVLMSILPLATVTFLILGLAYYWGIHHLSKKVSFSLGERRAQARTNQTIIINEFITGFHQMFTFRAIQHWVARFDRESRQDRTLLVQNQVWQAIPRPVMEFSALALLLGFLTVFSLTQPGNFSSNLASFGVFAVALIQLVPALSSIGSSWMGMFASLPDAERAHEILTGSVPIRQDGSRKIESFQRSITFENVTFSYPGRGVLFNNVNLEFEHGKTTAIVGASGSGKTTIVNLILGLFEPTDGRITVDGVLLQDIKRNSWLSKVGFVSQEPFTFNSTITENILLGRPMSSMEEIIAAAKTANAHDFISNLQLGYETEVGERGMKLSGGQQQRIAIARAVLDEPEILLFDEATSSLDSISENLVQEAIERASSDRTVIIIAHRISSVSNADKIIVLDNGQMVEQGTHQKLLSENGHYARLASSAR